MQLAEGFGHALEAGVQVGTHFGQRGPDGALQQGGLGDDVRRAARLDATDGDHGGVDGIDLPRHQGLDGRDQHARDDHRIGGLVGPRAVPAASLHADGETIGLGGDHAFGHHDLADPVVVGDVTAEDRRDAFELAGLQDHPCATAALLGGLEDEQHVALRWRLRKHSGGAEHHGHVRVVTAGVHFSLDARSERQVGVLGAGERVHLGAQGDRHLVPLAQTSDHGAAFARVAVGDTEPVELLDDHAGSVLLLEGELRMAVQRPPDLDHARIERLCLERPLAHDGVPGTITSRRCRCRAPGC